MTEQHPAIAELERLHALETPAPETSIETLYRWECESTREFRAQLEAADRREASAVADWRIVWFSRNHWRLAAAVGWGIALIALVMR